MAKRKARPQAKSRRASTRRQSGRGSSLSPMVVGRIILIAVIIVVVIWQWPNITSWIINTRDEIIRRFGWGLLLLVIALITLGVMVWRRRGTSPIRRFRHWLGGMAITMAIWGILAFS
ncbi:MAG: hypothetical protein J7K77_02050, partial [Dehalococcoidales bacterium]|nr:hypothetical protein [Dehalococcoidales bacterium]